MKRLLMMLALVAGASCSGDAPSGGDAGVTASVVSPNADGAVLLELPAGVEAVSAPSGITMFTDSESGRTRVLLVRETAGKFELRVRTGSPGATGITVLEASDGNDLPRADVSGYSVTIR